MPSLKSVKVRIKSIKSTQKITNAMKMVAASKLKRARHQLDASNQYYNEVNDIFKIIVNYAPNALNQANNTQFNNECYLIIIITSDKGLCGSFNQNIYKFVRLYIKSLDAEAKSFKIITIGQKGYDLIKYKYSQKVSAHFDNIFDKYGFKLDKIKAIVNLINEHLENQSYDKCLVFFNTFKSVIEQKPTMEQFIPFINNSITENTVAFSFEPQPEDMIKSILKQLTIARLFNVFSQNYTSEQAARMTAMDNASRNGGEIIKKLVLIYNRARQAYITKELIEVISGSEVAS